ncbi:glycosyltransferase family 4 protein [Candidatus Peregrinibacteria bacterium]|nr:glycosyltransferase family 4 protein [Candidatus Peregrinibacteria bacterium]
MRILVISSVLAPEHGWGTIARNTVMGLKAKGHDVSAVLQEKSQENLCPAIEGLPHPNTMMDSPLAWLRAARLIAKAIRAFKPDVIHIAVEPYALALPLLRPFMRIPPTLLILLGTYTVLPLHQTRTRWLMQRVYAQVTRFLSCSEYTRTQMLKAIEEKCSPALRDHVESHTTLFRLGVEDVPLPSKSPSSVKRILFLGGVKARKGVKELIDACGAFKRSSTVPFHLDVIGSFEPDTRYGKLILETIEKHDLQKNVTLHGHVPRERVEQALSEADLFVMLSKPAGIHFEGFGMVFLEAGIRGVPVIGPNGSGCKEAIDDGVSGYAVDPDDPEAVAQRMKWIFEEHRITAEGCRAWVKKHNVEQQTTAFEQAYGEMLSTPNGWSHSF